MVDSLTGYRAWEACKIKDFHNKRSGGKMGVQQSYQRKLIPIDYPRGDNAIQNKGDLNKEKKNSVNYLSGSERRSEKRFLAKQGAFAFLNSKNESFDDIDDMSMGEIAFQVLKLNPPKLGQITDLSKDGLSFQYVSFDCTDKESCQLYLLNADRRMLLKDLPFRTVSDLEVSDNMPLSPIKTNRLRVQFKRLTRRQKEQLDAFIKHSKGDQ